MNTPLLMKKHAGLKCPKCGGITQVTNSRPSENHVRRRRQCLVCGFRATTLERYLTTTFSAQRERALLDKIQQFESQIKQLREAYAESLSLPEAGL